MKRWFRLIALGRMTEKALLEGEGFKAIGRRSTTRKGVILRVDGEWALTPKQGNLVCHLLSVGNVRRMHEEEQQL